MIYLELKQAIINWLLDNQNAWQRVNACRDAFRQYIYDEHGRYIIGGESVSNFISDADILLYCEHYTIEKSI